MVTNHYKTHKELYETLGNRVCLFLSDLIGAKEIKIHSINHRVKAQESLISKMKREESNYRAINDITDILGIRIITQYEDTVDVIADLITQEQEFRIDWDHSKDKRKALAPDRFGYLSSHFIVSYGENRVELQKFKDIKFEIQIRSILQHAWASIEHDLGYKLKIEAKDIKRDFARLAGLLELADKEFISIRKKSEEYIESVPIEISNQPDDVGIDIISLADYIENHEKSKNLDKRIAQETGFSIFASNTDIHSAIKGLRAAGFKTIGDINQAIDQNVDLLLFVAKKWKWNYKTNLIPSGIGLHFLCHVTMLKHENSELLQRYLRADLFLSPEVVERDLLDIYAEYKALNQ